jgi:hypothetical protein
MKVDASRLNTRFIEHLLSELISVLPDGRDLSWMTNEHSFDADLNDAFGALRADRQSMHVEVCAVETDSVESGIVDAVLFSVYNELVLHFTFMKSSISVFYATRKAVVSL